MISVMLLGQSCVNLFTVVARRRRRRCVLRNHLLVDKKKMTKITWAASAGAAAAAAAAASLDGDLMTRRVIEERKTKVHAHTALLIKADILQFIFF